MPNLPPLVTLHGFLGDPHDFDEVLTLLRQRTLIPVELPGHGAHPWSNYVQSLDGCLDNIRSSIARQWGSNQPMDVLAYSMGGRMALELLARRALPFRRAVLIGAGTGFTDSKAKTDRLRIDEARAASLRTEGLDAFLKRWYAQPLFGQLRETAQFAEMMRRRRSGHASALAGALIAMSPAHHEDLAGRLSTCETDVLLVAGRDDSRYIEANAALAKRWPRARTALVDDCAHAPHVEAPVDTAEIAEAFLSDAIPEAGEQK